MAVFKCKRSGNIATFTIPDDIEIMRKHEGYIEVSENKVEEREIPSLADAAIRIEVAKVMNGSVVKKRGRPRK